LTTGDDVAAYNGCDSCAHSGAAGNPETINCVPKGRAFWWMMAMLAGWNSSGVDKNPVSSCFIATAIYLNQP